MKLSAETLRAEAAATGFRPEILEKVCHLLNLLEGLRSHPFLNRKDWRTIDPADVDFDPRELQNELVPLLRQPDLSAIGDPAQWARKLIDECRAALDVVLPFSPAEQEFLDRLLDHGDIRPELLTTDQELARQIAAQPGLHWKAQNVRQHKGRGK